MRFYMSCAAVAALRIKSSHFFIGSAILAYCKTKLQQKSEMRKDIVIELSYKGFG